MAFSVCRQPAETPRKQWLSPGKLDFAFVSQRISRKFRTEQDWAHGANTQTRWPKIFIPRGPQVLHRKGWAQAERNAQNALLRAPAKAGISSNATSLGRGTCPALLPTAAPQDAPGASGL